MSVFDTPSWTINWEVEIRVPSPQTTHHPALCIVPPAPWWGCVWDDCELWPDSKIAAPSLTRHRRDLESWHQLTHTRWWWPHWLINWASGHRDPGDDGEYLGTWESYDAKVQANLWEYWARRRPNTFINYRSDGLKIWPINTNLNFVRKTWVGNGFLLYKIQHVEP